MVQAAHLARRAFDDDVAKGDLPVAAQGNVPAAVCGAPAHADDSGAVKCVHRAHMGVECAAHKGRAAQEEGKSAAVSRAAA